MVGPVLGQCSFIVRSGVVMESLSAAKFQRELRAKMLYDKEYSIDELYVIYKSMVSLDFNLQYKIVSEKTFSNKLTEWSNVDNSWLIKKGKGKNAMYHKWICHRYPKLTRKQIHEKASELYARYKPW